jgi:hypothetical protein
MLMSSRQGHFLFPEKKVTKETGPERFFPGSSLNEKGNDETPPDESGLRQSSFLSPFHLRSEPKISKWAQNKMFFYPPWIVSGLQGTGRA